MQFKTGQIEQNIDAFLEWDGGRQYVVYQNWRGAEFYYSDDHGGGDETFHSLADRIANADDQGVLSATERLEVARGLHRRLKAQGLTFDSMGDA
jgi:hypothetical protein